MSGRGAMVTVAMTAVWMAAVAQATAATVPAGFDDRAIVDGFSGAAAFDMAPDGRIFVAEKPGVLKVVNPDRSIQTVLDIRNKVNSQIDRGLMGVAVDSDFATNRYVFLLYVLETGGEATAPKVSRLTRIQVNADNSVSNPSAPETVILGTVSTGPCPPADNDVDCIPADGLSHVVGTVRSAPDGTLFVGTGDAAYEAQNAPDPFRPYDDSSYAGKILRVDREGRGLPDHPFCPGNDDLTDVCTKIFAKGFRNPFRFTVRPGGAGVVAGDVGDATQEEVDLVEAGGNYGWPCYEGTVQAPRFRDTARCQHEYANEAPGTFDPPAYSYARGSGAAVIAGPTYPGGGPFPGIYHGSIFVGDFVQGWVRRLRLDSADRLVGVEDFATEWQGTDLNVTPDGRLAYTPGFGQVRAISYTAGNRPPVAHVEADPTDGAVPLTVQFRGDGSTDADGDPLSYEWDFGDGGDSREANPSHTYTEDGDFVARLTVTDARGGSDSATVTIASGNELPVPAIASPEDGALYRNGEPVTLRGSAVDPDDGELPGSSLRWRVRLHHNTHVHEFDELTGSEVEFTPVRSHDADSFYEIQLTATDSRGRSRTTSVEIRPETVQFTIESDPPGAPLTYDGTARRAPFTTDAAIGFDAVVSAAEQFQAGGTTWIFERWADGGERRRTVRIPDQPTGLVAVYREASLLERLGLGDLERQIQPLLDQLTP